jgi:hypothetical protein
MLIEGDDFHLSCAPNFGGKIDDAQAAFLPNDLAFRPSDHGIDELCKLAFADFHDPRP